MINSWVVFWHVLCVYIDECGQDLGKGSNFRGITIEFQGTFKQKEQFDTNSFCWNLCRLWSYPFPHHHGLEIAVQEHPTFNYLLCIRTSLTTTNQYLLFKSEVVTTITSRPGTAPEVFAFVFTLFGHNFPNVMHESFWTLMQDNIISTEIF